MAEGEHVEAGALLFVIGSCHCSSDGATAALVARQIEARAATLVETFSREEHEREKLFEKDVVPA